MERRFLERKDFWLMAGLLAAVVVTLATKAPGKDVEALFDASVAATKGE